MHAPITTTEPLQIQIFLGGVHESNHDYICERLCERIDGLLSCKFIDDNNQVELSYDKTILDQYGLLTAIQRLGHPVQLTNSQSVQCQLRIEGMHCNSCVSNICGSVLDLPGVIDIQLTFLDKLATITYDPSILQLNDIIDEIEKLSFQVAISNTEQVIATNEDIQVTSNTENSIRRTSIRSINDEIKFQQTKITQRSSRQAPVSKPDNETDLETCYFTVLGMTCASCVDSIQRNLGKVEGIHSVLVALLAQRAEVKYDSAHLLPTQIATLINNLGFQAEVLDTVARGMEIIDVNIENMTCSSCVDKIQNHMSKIPGITSVNVVLLTNRGRIQYDSSIIGPRDILKHISEDLGYRATVITENLKSEDLARSHRRITTQWRNSFITAAIFGIPAMIIMLVFMFKYKDHRKAPHVTTGLSVENLIMFLLATPVQIISGRYFYVQAYKSLKHKSANMEVLIVLATTVAYVYSIVVVIINMIMRIPSPMAFFDVSPMLFMFVALGRWLEHSAKAKTSDALKKLLSLQPPQGTLVKLDETGKIIEEKVVLAQLIQRDDLLKVQPGETIPTDGRIIDGTTTCDESLITGESMPIDKTIGAQIVGGTKNLDGLIIMRATHVGQDTALKQIIRLVEDAQTSKAPIQQLADKVAGYFVPFVVSISLLTLIIYIILGFTIFDTLKKYSSYYHTMDESSHGDGHSTNTYDASKAEIVLELAFRYAITVLSIACPCALGLATPTAVMVGTGGEPLESAHKIDTIVFDKTGTITKGKPSVVDKRIFVQNSHMTLDRMLAIAGTAESGSEHPLALAVRNHCKEHFGTDQLGLCRDFKALWGYGLQARVSHINCLVASTTEESSRTYSVLIGNREWMKCNHLMVDDGIDKTMSVHEHDGHTAVLVAIDGKIVGMLAIADEVKPTASLTIYALQSLGLRTILLTGDNVKTARAIASQVGIKTVFAEVLPTHKERFIANLKQDGKSRGKIAMVGDGINDSPALARADVGIAVGTGADVAVEAASIVLIRDELFDVLAAIMLSKKTVWRIRINFIFATVYNLVGIPIAAGVLLPAGVQLMPWMASAAMALSSVSVVVSSLLLRYFKKPTMEKFERDSRYRQWSLNKSVGIVVHRGIDNLPIHRSKATSIISSIKNSLLSQIVTESISAIKNAVMDEKRKATVFFSDERSLNQHKEEEMELQITAL
ncbi:hypothetical protein I4U23_028537 [Adineta vaga]|nr:hypothetical protein I4U23_028537 [Adineta vaga]